MSKFSDKFGDGLNTVAAAVDGNRFLGAIKDTFSVYMPFIIVGSFATLLNTLLCSPKAGLAQFSAFAWLSTISPAFSAVNFATMSFMTVPIVFILGVHLARKSGTPDIISGVIGLASFISVVPSVVSITDKGATLSAAGLSGTVLGAQGLFVGMIIAVLSVGLFARLFKIEALKIKMPPSVPSAIATSFNTLIPMLIVLCVFAIGGIVFKNISGSYINVAIYSLLQRPLEAIFQSAGGIIAIVVFSQLFWLLGIHGGLIISPIRNPLMAAAIAANTAAVAAGIIPNQPITYGFWVTFIVAGGAGIILSLIVAILVFSRRDDQRMVAKLGLLPAICGISEPVVFGLPLVLNPVYAIPFIFNSGIATAIALGAVKVGFLSCNTVDIPFGVPVVLNAFLGFGWQGVVVQAVILVACFFVWAPFVLVSNRVKAGE